MTLIELLLVLALLVMIGSMVVPVFTGSFSSVRLRRAADQVLTRWSSARAKAIESGQVMQFTFTPDTGKYIIEPWAPMSQDDTAATAPRPASAMASATAPDSSIDPLAASSQSDAAALEQRNVALPDQITFQRGDIAMEDALTGERSVQSMQGASDAASAPILFFPDGTTSEASVVIGNDRRQYIRLTLRSLTGVGRATETLTLDELERATGS